MTKDIENFIVNRCLESARCVEKLISLAPLIKVAANKSASAIAKGRKVMFCGNGGSAADSQHLAAELLGKFKRNRKALASLALTVDTSVLTAVGNDLGYKNVFARQLEGLAQKGDVLFVLSTSGNSENVLQAAKQAKKMGVTTVGFTGAGGGKLAPLCDILINVPATKTDLIQEMHIIVGHIICGLIEDAVTPSKGKSG